MKIKLETQPNTATVDIATVEPHFAVHTESTITTSQTPNPIYKVPDNVSIINNHNAPQFRGSITSYIGPQKYKVRITWQQTD